MDFLKREWLPFNYQSYLVDPVPDPVVDIPDLPDLDPDQ